ncbi:MAG: hypothetical protein IT326_10420, partial [Anaerolineae bacterium]|nr:hypothetical protein [Anaerolineae bacterium]
MTLAGGRLIEYQFRSRATHKEMRLIVYLPVGYDLYGMRYPAAYLLHPWGADERIWVDQIGFIETADALIHSGVVPPFIAVMPQGDKSFFINAQDRGGDFSLLTRLEPEYYAGALTGYGDYGDYLLDEVIPLIDRTYRTRASREARAIAGLSMGAAGAAVLAFSRPDLFSVVGIHSPLLFSERRPGPPWIFGMGEEQAFSPRDPVSLAAALDRDVNLRIYLDCGLDDERAWRAADLHAALKARHIPHTYTCRPGQYGPDY